MSTASMEQPPRKRVRIDENNNQQFDYSFLAGSVATLLPVMKELVSHYYVKFIKLAKIIMTNKKLPQNLPTPTSSQNPQDQASH
jgi:hypothetical protein